MYIYQFFINFIRFFVYLKIQNIIHNTKKSIHNTIYVLTVIVPIILSKKKKTIVPIIIDFIDHSKHVARCSCLSQGSLSQTQSHTIKHQACHTPSTYKESVEASQEN